MFKKYTFGEYFLIFYLIDCPPVHLQESVVRTRRMFYRIFILISTTVLYERVAAKDIFIEESNGRQCSILLLFYRYRKRILYFQVVVLV